MGEAYIIDAVRTPVGKRGGGLANAHPADLGAHVIKAIVERTGIDPMAVEDVIFGCTDALGPNAGDIARTCWLAAGLPEEVPGVTLDRQCGSSQQAVHFAAAAVASGQCDVVVAGGVESMSRVPMGASVSSGVGEPMGPKVAERYGGTKFDQGVGAELMARRWRLTREALDEYSLGSHRKAAVAQDAGAFQKEITPVPTDAGVVEADEGIRRDTSLEALAQLRTPFSADGVVTAGSSSQISDGAAALLITTPERAAQLDLAPVARIASTALAGDDPVIMLTAPIPATKKVLGRAGLSIDDIGVYEVNEAFAPVPLAWLADIGADPSRLNPYGGAIALGHPLGATGARITATLLNELERRDERYGVATMCIGFGQAIAAVVERI